MTKPEPSIFDQADDEADEVAMREGEADADAGKVIPHAEFSAWLETWGTLGEKPPPGDVLASFPVRPSIGDMIERLAALPKPGTVEARDEEPLPERPGL
jgi:hypothetical protein